MTAWDDYCAAAQRLDAIRRGAASAAGEQAQAVRVARDELTAVRARLVPQQARLRESGVPDEELRPTAADAAAAGQTMAGGPAEVLVALRQARMTADGADAALLGTGGGPARAGAGRASGRRSAALRNLLVYGPFAAAVLLAQIALYLAAGAGRSQYALGCALLLPVVAFALGWLGVGIAFPAPPGGRVDRTPAFGALVCAVPLALTAVTAGLLWVVA
jgi:hypothetical protein